MRGKIKFDIELADLDNPVFTEFLRSPEFSTWLVIVSRAWRSAKKHSMGLDAFYKHGLLTAAVKVVDIAAKLGTSERSIKTDISNLADARRVGVIRTDAGNVYVLGEYTQTEDGAFEITWYAMEPVEARALCPTGRDLPNDPTTLKPEIVSFDELFGAREDAPKKPRMGFGLEEELEMLVGRPQSDWEKTVREAGWDSYEKEIFTCCVWFCEATLIKPPRGKTIQSDWIRAFREHMQDNPLGLKEKYLAAALELKRIGYTIRGPMSLTRTIFGSEVVATQTSEITIVRKQDE